MLKNCQESLGWVSHILCTVCTEIEVRDTVCDMWMRTRGRRSTGKAVAISQPPRKAVLNGRVNWPAVGMGFATCARNAGPNWGRLSPALAIFRSLNFQVSCVNGRVGGWRRKATGSCRLGLQKWRWDAGKRASTNVLPGQRSIIRCLTQNALPDLLHCCTEFILELMITEQFIFTLPLRDLRAIHQRWNRQQKGTTVGSLGAWGELLQLQYLKKQSMNPDCFLHQYSLRQVCCVPAATTHCTHGLFILAVFRNPPLPLRQPYFQTVSTSHTDL